MTDFLNHFSRDNYDKMRAEEKQAEMRQNQIPPQQQSISKNIFDEHYAESASAASGNFASQSFSQNQNNQRGFAENLEQNRNQTQEAIPNKQSYPETFATNTQIPRRESQAEEFEKDPTYQKKKKRKFFLWGLLALILCIAGGFGYYQFSHVRVPNFEGKPVSEAKIWADEKNVKLTIKETYSMKYDANQVMKQSFPAEKKIKKGKYLTLTVSMGANPDEVVGLPNFKNKTRSEAEQWAKENKMENITFVSEYHDKVPENDFIKQELADKDLSMKKFKRKDRVILYFSSGKEKLEKNIAMPDFTKKAKSEVESWAKTNEIDVTYEEADSDSIEEGLIIAQSVPKDEKVAKKSKLTVKVSLGKGVLVPNFAELNAIQAGEVGANGLSVIVKNVFSADVPYGKMIAQSVPAGTKLTAKDNKPVTVTYSEGRPYIKDYRGQIEGDLPKLFFEDYQSKGANIRYTIVRVYTDEPKGTVVDQSIYNEYIGMDYVVQIAVSAGS